MGRGDIREELQEDEGLESVTGSAAGEVEAGRAVGARDLRTTSELLQRGGQAVGPQQRRCWEQPSRGAGSGTVGQLAGVARFALRGESARGAHFLSLKAN
jgi:hypothetical protein